MTTLKSRQIFENLYGGPAYSPKDIRRWFKNANLKLPVNVIAIELERHILKTLKFNSKELDIWMIDSDKSMLYITYNGSSKKMQKICDEQGLLHGDSIPCDNLEQWIWAVRKAISSARQHYLARLSDADREDFTWLDEREQFSIAMKSFLQERDWQKNVHLWLDIVLIRHQQTINDCRRKILFFLTFATANVDMNVNLSFIFRQAIEQIESTYTFSDLRQIVILIIENIHPYVISQNLRFHISQHSFSAPVEKALAYMQKFYTSPISRRDVSKSCFVSPEYLSRIFKDETGYTISKYLQILRVDYAKQLLSQGHKGILSIALESGFNSITHFHRVFKAQVQTSPFRYSKRVL